MSPSQKHVTYQFPLDHSKTLFCIKTLVTKSLCCKWHQGGEPPGFLSLIELLLQNWTVGLPFFQNWTVLLFCKAHQVSALSACWICCCRGGGWFGGGGVSSWEVGSGTFCPAPARFSEIVLPVECRAFHGKPVLKALCWEVRGKFPSSAVEIQKSDHCAFLKEKESLIMVFLKTQAKDFYLYCTKVTKL